MKVDSPLIAEIIKTKYPFECNIFQKKGYEPSRMFTDDFYNYIVITEDQEDSIIHVTFLNSELSNIYEVFNKRNQGTFFIVNDINDLEKIIDMNLVYYQDYISEKESMDKFEKSIEKSK